MPSKPAIYVLCLVTSGTVAAYAGMQQSNLDTALRVPPTVTLGEPVELTAVIVNNSVRSVTIDLGYNREGAFMLHLTSPDGRVASVQPSPTGAGGISRNGEVTLKSQEQYAQALLLNQWFQILQVGDYALRVQVRAQQLDSGLSLTKDEVVRFKVLPRNEKQLRAKCDALLSEIVKGPAEASLRAATVLASIRDQVAVQYLYKAIRSGVPVEPIAITGLERIGTADAIEVLQSIAKTAGGETWT